MCTAATYKTKDFYMGRTLDYEFSYGEQIAAVPRNFPFDFSSGKSDNHYAMIGMAHIADGFPLFMTRRTKRGCAWRGLILLATPATPSRQTAR